MQRERESVDRLNCETQVKEVKLPVKWVRRITSTEGGVEDYEKIHQHNLPEEPSFLTWDTRSFGRLSRVPFLNPLVQRFQPFSAKQDIPCSDFSIPPVPGIKQKAGKVSNTVAVKIHWKKSSRNYETL